MTAQESTILLSIRETQAPEQSFLFHVMMDGEVLTSNQTLSATDSKAVRQFSNSYSELFERRNQRAQVAPGSLNVLGEELFNVWLAQSWDKIMNGVAPGTRRLLVIASDVPDILNLPWELLHPPDGDFLGFDPWFNIRRLPWLDKGLRPAATSLPPRPLRILSMACAPEDKAELDNEREENSLLRAVARAGHNVAFDSCDLGTFEELRQRINEFQPHVVHLTGHGVVQKDGLGYFAFENDRGETDLRSSVEVRQELLTGSSVQCAFISGCQTGKAPPVAALGGICQGLVGGEVPLAIGWAASVGDDIAIQFATTFYNTLASGQTVDRALNQARQAIRKSCEQTHDPSWTLPVLYTTSTQGYVFDTDPSHPPSLPARPSVVQEPLPGMTQGYAEDFVNRRREIQRLLPALREGKIQGLLITGLGGAGKSTLATRLARKLEADGFTPIPIPSSTENPLSAARLLQISGDAFLAAGMRNEYAMLRDANVPAHDRLIYSVAVLNRSRFILVLDNFEVNMDESTRSILDKELANFYSHLLTNLAGNSRCIITCRYPPAESHGAEVKTR